MPLKPRGFCFLIKGKVEKIFLGLEFIMFFPKNVKNLLNIVLDSEIQADVFVDSDLGIIYDFLYTSILVESPRIPSYSD